MSYLELFKAIVPAHYSLNFIHCLEGSPLTWLVNGQHYSGLELFDGYHST